MCEHMRRRGPDANGEWRSVGGKVVLGHQRLSILDLSAAGGQPMVDGPTGCSLVFNGEIYNFRELRADLRKSGHAFKSESDTEVLLQGYLHWGEGVLDRVRGMFALALWDARKKSLWLARDPYGIKPLYYSDTAGYFAFASQVAALRAHIAADTSADPAGVVGFMLMGTVPEPHTCYRGIRSLPAGHTLWVSAAGLSARRPFASVAQTWREAAQQPQRLEEGELNERVRESLLASVRAHRVSDVPVGAFLSAGIDSGALVGMMAEGNTSDLQTVTLGFNSFQGTDHDETPHAERLARLYETSHKTIWTSDAEAQDLLPGAMADMDQPSIDGFNTWLVSKHTAETGMKVVVSGVGGDELFGGYAHFEQIPRWHRSIRRLRLLPGLLPLLGYGAGLAAGFGLIHAKAAALPRFGRDLAGLYLVRRGLFMPSDLPKVLDGGLLREGLATLEPPRYLQTGIGKTPPRDYAAIAALEASFYLRNQLLRDSDWASMAHSLELRTPLVDYQLLRELAPVLVERPEKGRRKRPLAMAPRPRLPTEVLERRKSGFALPMDRWLRQSEALEHWRHNQFLQQDGVPWARRMAYSLLANHVPGAVIA